MDYRTFSLLGIICEEILMKFVYTSDKDDEIVKHEKIMLEKYSNILDFYRNRRKENNYEKNNDINVNGIDVFSSCRLCK